MVSLTISYEEYVRGYYAGEICVKVHFCYGRVSVLFFRLKIYDKFKCNLKVQFNTKTCLDLLFSKYYHVIFQGGKYQRFAFPDRVGCIRRKYRALV